MNTNDEIRIPQKDSKEEKVVLGRFTKDQIFQLFLSKLNRISDICGIFIKDEDIKNVYPIYDNVRFPKNKQIKFIQKDNEEFPEIIISNDSNILVPIKNYETVLAVNPSEFSSLLTFNIDPQVHCIQCATNEIYNTYATNIFTKLKDTGDIARNYLNLNKLNINYSLSDIDLKNSVYNTINRTKLFIVDPIIKNIKIAINTLKHQDTTINTDRYFIICDEMTNSFLDIYLKDIPTCTEYNVIKFVGYFNLNDENIPTYNVSINSTKDRQGLVIVGKCADKLNYKGLLTYIKSIDAETLEDCFITAKTIFKLVCSTDFINTELYDYLSFKIDYSNI